MCKTWSAAVRRDLYVRGPSRDGASSRPALAVEQRHRVVAHFSAWALYASMSALTSSIRRLCALAVTAVLASPILMNDGMGAVAYHLPPGQQVLRFIADTIDWYRHLPNAQQIGTEPADFLFVEDNRSITKDVVRLSFEFGKAVAAIDPVNAESALDPPAAKGEIQDLVAAKAKVDANAQQAVNQLNSLTQATHTARDAEGEKLSAKMAEIKRRVQLLSAMSANYQALLGFIRTATVDPDRPTDLAEVVENLEGTVPDVSASAPSPISNMPADPSRAPSGIVGMLSRVSAIARKQRLIDGAIARTDELIKSLQTIRAPIRESFRKELPTFSLDTTTVDVLEQQESNLTDLIGAAKTVSPAIGALIKQQTMLNLYRSHLTGWRSEVQDESRAAWKGLLVRLGVLGTAIALLLGIRMLVRGLIYRQVRHLDTREMLLIGERVLLWVIIVAAVLFSFAFDLSSLATFLGLLSAGVAVSLHDVFLAIGGYLLMVRKFHVRIGERVQISGVSGEVSNLGLMQFELSEIDPATEERTGRVVYFSNSYVFVSPATPLFRRVSAPVRDHEVVRS
jgi:hypothetical protein